MSKNKSINVKSIAVTSSILLTGLGMSGCGTSINSIYDSIGNGNYEEAIKSFNEWNSISDEDYNKLIEKLNESINVMTEKYINNEIDYKSMVETLDTISNMNISKMRESIIIAYAETESLKRSKDNYSKAVEAYNNGEYADSLLYYSRIIERDVNNYKEASEKKEELIDKVIEQAYGYAQSSDYAKGLEILYNIHNAIGVNEKIDNAVTSIETEYNLYLKEQAKQETLETAKSDFDRGELEQAIKKLSDFRTEYGDDADVDKLYNEYSGKYVTMIIEKINVLREERRYEEAISVLSDANLIVDSTDFTEMMATLEKEKPVYITEVKFQNSKRYEKIADGKIVTDTIGNNYTHGNLYEISSSKSGWNDPENGYAEYYLGYKYSTLYGTVAVDDVSSNIKCQLIIEGDGTVLKTIDLSRLTVPTEINVDVSGVSILKLRTKMESVNAEFYVILSGFSFLK